MTICRVDMNFLTWDQAVFSFRFENYIPAVAVRDNVWESLKLGLISGYEFLNTNITHTKFMNHCGN